MESWFDVLFRIPFTIFWVARRIEKPRLFLLAKKKFDSGSGQYYFEAI